MKKTYIGPALAGVGVILFIVALNLDYGTGRAIFAISGFVLGITGFLVALILDERAEAKTRVIKRVYNVNKEIDIVNTLMDETSIKDRTQMAYYQGQLNLLQIMAKAQDARFVAYDEDGNYPKRKVAE